jgi:glycosyltransferase involved in cell wall biosynthesis
METYLAPTATSRPNWHIAILIPARNEKALLQPCLESITSACTTLPYGVTSEVILVSDSSTDGTLERAQTLLGSFGVAFQTNVGCVGAARALAANIALSRYDGPLSRCWLANTDADCEVPSNWLHDQLLLAQQGCEAVAGVVDVTDFSEHAPWVEERFRTTYKINEDDSHPHVHGANLGVRADIYLAVGGWNSLATAEDHDLWSRLRQSGATCMSTAKSKVLTSGRRIGRAPLGFAMALAAHNEPSVAS